jgi:hypothetical protein
MVGKDEERKAKSLDILFNERACPLFTTTRSGRSAASFSRLGLCQPPMLGNFFTAGGYVQ